MRKAIAEEISCCNCILPELSMEFCIIKKNFSCAYSSSIESFNSTILLWIIMNSELLLYTIRLTKIIKFCILKFLTIIGTYKFNSSIKDIFNF